MHNASVFTVLPLPANGDLTNLFPCSQKEADTCLPLHVADAVQKGFRKVYVCTVNTDVMVLAIAMFDCI